MCANHPCKSSASAPPLKTKRQATFYQGASLSEYLKCTQLTYLSSSVLKPDTVSVNSVRRAILWFWLLYKMMSDTHVPFLLISNYHVLDFGNRLHRSVWRLSQALQLVHADFPRHASQRLFLKIPALGLSMLLSSPRPESARAFTGRRNSHSGRGEDFLTGQPNFFTETAVTPERRVEKWFPKWEINHHAEG